MPVTELGKKLEECPVCRSVHEAFKETFCELVKKLNDRVNIRDCKELIDKLFLYRTITKEELARRLGISLEDADVIFRKALEITFKTLEKVKKGEK